MKNFRVFFSLLVQSTLSSTLSGAAQPNIPTLPVSNNVLEASSNTKLVQNPMFSNTELDPELEDYVIISLPTPEDIANSSSYSSTIEDLKPSGSNVVLNQANAADDLIKEPKNKRLLKLGNAVNLNGLLTAPQKSTPSLGGNLVSTLLVGTNTNPAISSASIPSQQTITNPSTSPVNNPSAQNKNISLTPTVPTTVVPPVSPLVTINVPSILNPASSSASPLATINAPPILNVVVPSVPTIPSVSPTVSPQATVNIPSVNIPSVPTVNLPSLEIPSVNIPSVPITPSDPKIDLPKIPTIEIPSLPTIVIPSLPTIPPIEIPSLPTIEIPSLPPVEIPSLLND